MSRILKRPMFRIGGSANNGIMSMAAPRRNYQNGTEYEKQLQKTLPFLERVAGPGPSVRSDLGDLLISGGLNLLSGKGAGKGTLGALAESYSDPYQTFSKARSAEDTFKRQLGLSAATGAIGSVDAQEAAAKDRALKLQIASIKEKNKETFAAQLYETQVKEMTDGILKAAENRIISKFKGAKATDIARKTVDFIMNAPNLKGNLIEIDYTDTGKKGVSQYVPDLSYVQPGQIFYDATLGQWKKRVSEGRGKLDFVTLDSSSGYQELEIDQ
jgi:hypothetical protein